MKNSRKYNVVIFDLDDTLVYSDYMNINRFKVFFKKYKIKLLDVEKIKKQLYAFLTTFEDTFQNVLINEDQVVDYFAKECSFIYDYNIDKKEVFDDVMKSAVDISSMIKGADILLDYLKKKGYTLFVLTNWFYKVQIEKLKKAKLYEYFDKVYGIDNTYLKPNKKAFEQVLNKYKPDECIMIGDSYKYDVAGAKNMGIDSILINQNAKDEQKILANYYVKKLEEIREIL